MIPLSKSKVFVNRTLNLRKIKWIGLDMDHTLIRYHLREFENLAHGLIIEKLIKNKGYPEEIQQIPFQFDLALRGLVLDRKRGNLLKLSRYASIRRSSHGTRAIGYREQESIYRSTYVDLNDGDYLAADTNFSISLVTLYAQIVDLKDARPDLKLPDYKIISDDVLNALDEAHRDNTLKSSVAKDLKRYVIVEPEVAAGLERMKRFGKKIFLLTNSDFHYTQLLLSYAIDPHLKEHKSWQDLFEISITFAKKPKFFVERGAFLKVDPKNGSLINWDQPLVPGIFQGGSAVQFTRDLQLSGDDILYIGDHIYGDILRLKKDCNWRTAMVLEELADELESNKKSESLNAAIEELMDQKEPLEEELTQLQSLKVEAPSQVDEAKVEALIQKIKEIDQEISGYIVKKQSVYNPHWGQLMRAGNEESYLAYQVDRYACIYMPKLKHFLEMSPKQYFRAFRRPLAHEAEHRIGEENMASDF